MIRYYLLIYLKKVICTCFCVVEAKGKKGKGRRNVNDCPPAVGGGKVASQQSIVQSKMATEGIPPISCGFAWSKPNLDCILPPARGGASAVMANRKMVVFGGHFSANEEFTYLNDTWVIDLDTLTWHEARCGGEVPPPRYGHTAEVVRLFCMAPCLHVHDLLIVIIMVLLDCSVHT